MILFLALIKIKQCFSQIRLYLISILAVATFFLIFTPNAFAEGSKDMVADGGDRPYTEWASATTADIIRQTLLKVYVEKGETVYFGSSVPTSQNNPNDIVYRSPFGSQNGSCDVLATGFGLIDTVTKETAGPLPLTAGGYTPCTFVATETGIYEFEMRAPSSSGNPPGNLLTTAAFSTGGTQNSGVSAWDITVVDPVQGAKKGRVFTSYVAMNMGSNNVAPNLNSDFYIQTKDGYLYRTDMNGVDPFGFVFFSSNRGFVDNDGSTLYHSTIATSNAMDPFSGNAKVQRPDVPDTDTNVTHTVFFNPPDPSTLIALGIPTAPVLPPKPTNFEFVGGTGGSGNQTKVGIGGNFTFDVTIGGSYQIIIDVNNNGVFGDANDRFLQNPALPGNNYVSWDGKDSAGVDLLPLPSNAPYKAQIIIRVGEYHFPMLDAENNPNGFIIELQNAPAPYPTILKDINNNPINKYTVYYNDDNYTTSNGTTVNLNGTGATNPRNALLGINSLTNNGEHEFNSTYGDFKGIDTWTFFPSEPVFADIVITTTNVANVRATKSVQFLTDSDSDTQLTVGDVVKYSVTYSNLNTGDTVPAIDFTIEDNLPPQLTYVPGSATITNQTAGNTIALNPSYNGSGTLTTLNAQGLRVDDTITITFSATINSQNNGNPIYNQARGTFKTPDNPNAAQGKVFTDAISPVTSSDPPVLGNYVTQLVDDGKNVGNDPSNTADDDPTLIKVQFANVKGTKSAFFLTDADSNGQVTLNDIIRYEITYNNLNLGTTLDTVNFTINDILQPQLTYVAGSATIINQTTAVPITLNGSYNGTLANSALTNPGTLGVDESITIQFNAKITKGSSTNTIPNQANAIFSTLNSTLVSTQLSDANDSGGIKGDPPLVGQFFTQKVDDLVDTGNDNNNTGDDDPTLITVLVPPIPNILLLKRITGVYRDRTPVVTNFLQPFSQFNEDPTDSVDDPSAWVSNQWPDSNQGGTFSDNIYLRGAVDGGEVESDDEIEFTIYFVSNGTVNPQNTILCDLVPKNLDFVANAYGSGKGIAFAFDDVNGDLLPDTGQIPTEPNQYYSNNSDGDKGKFFSPGTDATATCGPTFTVGANTNGIIAVDVGSLRQATGQGTPTNSYGFIRFRAKVK